MGYDIFDLSVCDEVVVTVTSDYSEPGSSITQGTTVYNLFLDGVYLDSAHVVW